MSECIYKFVEQPQQKKPKKQIYRSKYDPNSPLIGSTFCMQGTTAVDGKGFHSLKKVRRINFGGNTACHVEEKLTEYSPFPSRITL